MLLNAAILNSAEDANECNPQRAKAASARRRDEREGRLRACDHDAKTSQHAAGEGRGTTVWCSRSARRARLARPKCSNPRAGLLHIAWRSSVRLRLPAEPSLCRRTRAQASPLQRSRKQPSWRCLSAARAPRDAWRLRRHGLTHVLALRLVTGKRGARPASVTGVSNRRQ